MTAQITMTEEGLRSLTWEVVEVKDYRGTSRWLLEGTWPGGRHAIFLTIPVDEVTPCSSE